MNQIVQLIMQQVVDPVDLRV